MAFGQAPCSPTSPGAVWRLCSDLVSPFIAQQLSDRWGSGNKRVPHLWTTATLAPLLKAGKNGSEPKHFRPIGLLDALGKSCISMVLQNQIRPGSLCSYCTQVLLYCCSTEDALRRVFYHCAEARQLRETHARNPHQRFAGLKMPAWQGGIQICLDLASAFDTVRLGLMKARHLSSSRGLVSAPMTSISLVCGPASLLDGV